MKYQIENGQIELINAIKLLLYKENKILFEKINYEDNSIFLNPLLFVYFNNKTDSFFRKETLEELLQGYFKKRQPLKINYSSYKKNEIAYIPKVGYFKKSKNKPFDNIILIPNTNIELIRHPIIYLKSIYKDFKNNRIEEDKVETSKILNDYYIEALAKAFLCIKNYSPSHYDLISKCCKKVVLFRTNPENTNSFATINAHGIAFINVFQKEYDEVFFVDDIAHQTGHIIFTTLLFNKKKYFLIDETINIGNIIKSKKEYRDFYVLFHALYTYYTILLCLDNCLKNNCFDVRQIHEAKGRIGFYLLKFKSDLTTFQKVITHYKNIDVVLTKDGVKIHKIIDDKYHKIDNKWGHITKDFYYKNQPYNFTYNEFIKLNPLKDD